MAANGSENLEAAIVTARSVKIGHATELVINLMPAFGERYEAPDELGRGVGDLKIIHVPCETADAVRDTFVAACEFLRYEFSKRE